MMLSGYRSILWLVFLLTFSGSARATILDIASYSDHTYFLLSPGTWNEKEAEAKRLGGHLITISSSAENEFIRQRWIAERIACVEVVGQPCPPVWPPLPWENPRVFEAWLGFTDTSTEGNFVWIDGQPVTFVNWALGVPFDFTGNEDFAIIASGGKWVDVEGTAVFAGVAEVASIPEPSAFLLLLAALPLVLWTALRRHEILLPRASKRPGADLDHVRASFGQSRLLLPVGAERISSAPNRGKCSRRAVENLMQLSQVLLNAHKTPLASR